MVTVVPSTVTELQKVSCGRPEALGDHRRHHGHARVGRLAAEDDQVGVAALDRRGQRQGGGHGVRAVQAVVDDVHAGVGAHRQRLADGVGGLGRTHGQDDHLAAVRLDQPQGLLDRVLVDLIHHGVHRAAVQRVVGGAERLLRPAVRDLLHTDNDLHGRVVDLSHRPEHPRGAPVASSFDPLGESAARRHILPAGNKCC